MRHTLSIILLLPLLCGCEAHKNERGLVVTLSREAASDTTPVKMLNVWATNNAGTVQATRSYASAKELALDVIDVPNGDYGVLVAMNLPSAYTFSESPLQISINEQNPEHAYYGVGFTSVTSAGLSFAKVALRRILAQLTISVTNLPARATMDATIVNSATGIYPLKWDETNACYGVANTTAASVSMPMVSDENSVSSTCRLMPTVATDANTVLKLTLRHDDGTTLSSNVIAPKMYAAGNYVFEVKYDELSEGLILSAVRINSWTEGWVITGEITEADN